MMLIRNCFLDWQMINLQRYAAPKDEEEYVRCAVLKNKALSPELKEKLEKRTEIVAALATLEENRGGYDLTHCNNSGHDSVVDAMTTIMGDDGWIYLTDYCDDLDPEDGGQKPEESYEDFIDRIEDFNSEQIREAIDKAEQMLKEKIVDESIGREALIAELDKIKNKCAVAKDSINKTILAELAKDQNENVRFFVAKNPNTPLEVLAELAKDQLNDVRREVAKNPNTSAEILSDLAKDQDGGIRYYAADNRHIPPEVLAELAKDQHVSVRRCVAGNSTSPETLSKLAQDQDKDVRFYVAMNRHTSSQVLSDLAKDQEYRVRRCVAENWHTPPEVLTELAKDQNEDVRLGVAKNPNTLSNILSSLTKDLYSPVRDRAEQNLSRRQAEDSPEMSM